MRSLRIMLIGLVLVAAACGGTTDQVPEGGETTATTSESATETNPPSESETAGATGCEQYEIGSEVSENVLLIDAPAAEAEFPPNSTVAGCTNAFEAAFQWELLGAEGAVLASGNETASCGSGCLGVFEFTVDHQVEEPQDGTMRLFVESAKDGSVQMETDVAVRLVP